MQIQNSKHDIHNPETSIFELSAQFSTLMKLAYHLNVERGIRSVGIGKCPYMIVSIDVFQEEVLPKFPVGWEGPVKHWSLGPADTPNHMSLIQRESTPDDCGAFDIYYTARFVVNDLQYDIQATEEGQCDS